VKNEGTARIPLTDDLTRWHRTPMGSLLLYSHFIRLAFLKFLAYRLRYYTGVVTYTIFVAGNYYLYKALFESRAIDVAAAQSEPLIGGLTLAEMITYVAISWIGRSFTFNNILRDLKDMIHSGAIGTQLIKPYHVQSMMMFEAIGEAGFRLLMFTLPIMVVVVPIFGITAAPEPILYLWTFVSFCLALVVHSQFNFILGCLAFSMKNIQGVIRAKMVSMDFLTGVVVPFTFFPETVQRVIEWLPFQAISYIPVTIYLGKRPGGELVSALLLQLGWAVFLFILGRVIWHRSVKRVIVQGG
jgi:ABC-2 type transport system permease protein